MEIKVGLSLASIRPALWPAVTEEADRLGYESVWIPEHLVLPVGLEGSPYAGAEHPPVPPDVPVFDVFSYLAFLAGRTERIHLGTQVYNIGLRHPFVSARGAATVDIVSDGRLEFGVGASWLEQEWQAVGLDFASRGRRVDEALQVCCRLWSESVIEHHGEFFDFAPVMFEPKPVQQPRPTLHIGGDGPAALRRAALVGDGWIPMNHRLDELPPKLAKLAELRAEAGVPGKVEITLGAGPATRDDLERHAEAGVDRVLVRPWRSTRDALESLRGYAEDVLGA